MRAARQQKSLRQRQREIRTLRADGGPLDRCRESPRDAAQREPRQGRQDVTAPVETAALPPNHHQQCGRQCGRDGLRKKGEHEQGGGQQVGRAASGSDRNAGRRAPRRGTAPPRAYSSARRSRPRLPRPTGWRAKMKPASHAPRKREATQDRRSAGTPPWRVGGRSPDGSQVRHRPTCGARSRRRCVIEDNTAGWRRDRTRCARVRGATGRPGR